MFWSLKMLEVHVQSAPLECQWYICSTQALLLRSIHFFAWAMGVICRMKRVCSKTKKPCDCLCQDCGRDRWGCLKPPCICPLQLNGTFGLDFAVRKQRLKCKCRWKNGRVLPSWMCKCKVRATWFLVDGYIAGFMNIFGVVADFQYCDYIFQRFSEGPGGHHMNVWLC